MVRSRRYGDSFLDESKRRFEERNQDQDKGDANATHNDGIGVALTILLGAFACAATPTEEFLSDYSKLQPVKGDENEKTWAVADAETRALKYKSVMIDQPEIFISPDSKYKGAKPDDLKALADELRNAFRDRDSGVRQVHGSGGARSRRLVSCV